MVTFVLPGAAGGLKMKIYHAQAAREFVIDLDDADVQEALRTLRRMELIEQRLAEDADTMRKNMEEAAKRTIQTPLTSSNPPSRGTVAHAKEDQDSVRSIVWPILNDTEMRVRYMEKISASLHWQKPPSIDADAVIGLGPEKNPLKTATYYDPKAEAAARAAAEAAVAEQKAKEEEELEKAAEAEAAAAAAAVAETKAAAGAAVEGDGSAEAESEGGDDATAGESKGDESDAAETVASDAYAGVDADTNTTTTAAADTKHKSRAAIQRSESIKRLTTGGRKSSQIFSTGGLNAIRIYRKGIKIKQSVDEGSGEEDGILHLVQAWGIPRGNGEMTLRILVYNMETSVFVGADITQDALEEILEGRADLLEVGKEVEMMDYMIRERMRLVRIQIRKEGDIKHERRNVVLRKLIRSDQAKGAQTGDEKVDESKNEQHMLTAPFEEDKDSDLPGLQQEVNGYAQGYRIEIKRSKVFGIDRVTPLNKVDSVLGNQVRPAGGTAFATKGKGPAVSAKANIRGKKMMSMGQRIPLKDPTKHDPHAKVESLITFFDVTDASELQPSIRLLVYDLERQEKLRHIVEVGLRVACSFVIRES